MFLALSILNLNFNFLILKKITTLLGIYSVWKLYDYIFSKKFVLKNNYILLNLTNFTFFVYLFHEPLLNVFLKLIVVAFGKNSFGYLVSYLFSPILFYLLAVCIGNLLNKFFNSFYLSLVGYRYVIISDKK